MGIQIEFNPDLALRAFGTPNRLKGECLPEKLEQGETYPFLKKGQRNYWFEGEVPLLETKGNKNKIQFKMTEQPHDLYERCNSLEEQLMHLIPEKPVRLTSEEQVGYESRVKKYFEEVNELQWKLIELSTIKSKLEQCPPIILFRLREIEKYADAKTNK